ncbi:zinc-binding alcohol dehydrogenase [Chloroflexi bacterium TSY]|nr:zinc-binding alcohol dehydrogenase [Chloroflexi bacterium TSY]
MKGQRLALDSAGQVHVESFDVPVPESDQILVRANITQVSAGSEINAVRSRRSSARPDQGRFGSAGLGYTFIGHVEAIGKEIHDFSVGDRVICGGNHASHWLVTPSRAQEHAAIPQQYHIEKLPDEVSDREGCFCILGDVALHGVRLAQLQIGESVVIHGLGVVGLLALQLCRLSGVSPLIGVDLVEERLALAQQLGASHTINASNEDVIATIRDLTELPWRWRGALPNLEAGAGAEVQLHTTSYIGNYPTMIKAAADRGRIILVGATAGSVPIESHELFRREITLRGSYQTGMIDTHPYWPWTRARNRATILDLITRGQLGVVQN